MMQVKMAQRMTAFGLGSLCAGFLLVAQAVPAVAEDHGRHEFHEHDVHHFDHYEMGMWRGGVWRHEFRFGRSGWWWVTGGAWYYYDRPIYPYPMIVSEMYYAEPVMVAPPPQTVIVPGAPVMMPPPPPQPQMLYYCDNPAGYYPYVATCSVPFRPVPATPQ